MTHENVAFADNYKHIMDRVKFILECDDASDEVKALI